MNNKVKFLRGTSAEYEAKTKDNDTFYYTTDTKKLYLGETEITGIEIDDSSTTVTDKTWSAKKISDSIPTSLPANGGNAATVNGKKINWNIYSNSTQFGKALTDTANDIWLALPNQSIFITEVKILTDSSWNFPSDVDTSFHTLVMMKHGFVRPAGIYIYPKTDGNIYYALVDTDGNFVSKWYKINDGGNAATVNNHTVESDVPANAVFTDTTNSDVVSDISGVVELDGLQGGVPFSEILINKKNLIPYPYSDIKESFTRGGITYSRNQDGSISVSGTAGASGSFFNFAHDYTLRLKKNIKYVLSLKATGEGFATSDVNLQYIKTNGALSFIGTMANTQRVFTLAQDTDFRLWFRVKAGVTIDCIIYPQLEIGEVATEFDTPIPSSPITLTVNGAEYSIMPDSNPYTVPNDIRQQDGINNVFVSVGEVTVTGVRRNAAMNRAWKVLDKSCGEGLLRNSNFRINQREVSGTITDTGYFLDCWQLVSGSVTVNSDGTITLNGTIKQILENDPGENVTASASAGTAVYNRAAKTFMLSAKGETVAWAKLEYGDIATPYFAPEYMTELYRCRRYFQRFRNTDDHFVFFGTGLAFSASQGFAMIPLFAPLRSAEAHTAVLSGTLYCTNDNAVGTTAIEITEITGTDISEKAGTVSISFKASGLTKSTPLMIQFRDTSSYLDISSEL